MADKKDIIDWHTMFYSALKLTLGDKLFTYTFEHSLTKEPLKIDVIIVKKLADVEPKALIAKLFLVENIVEFKGVGDYISIEDFYKIHAYAYLYRNTNPTSSIKEMTLTLVESRYPEKLIKHLKEELGYSVEEKWTGIYYVYGGQFPVQIINTKALVPSDLAFLKNIDRKLSPEALDKMMRIPHDESQREAYVRYIDLLTSANPEALEEVNKMMLVEFSNRIDRLAQDDPEFAQAMPLVSKAAFNRVDAERQRAEAERQKAEAERQRAEAKAAALEEQVRLLEQKLQEQRVS
jgi:hypothetical protein